MRLAIEWSIVLEALGHVLPTKQYPTVQDAGMAWHVLADSVHPIIVSSGHQIVAVEALDLIWVNQYNVKP
jgi:hypothetical protein